MDGSFIPSLSSSSCISFTAHLASLRSASTELASVGRVIAKERSLRDGSSSRSGMMFKKDMVEGMTREVYGSDTPPYTSPPRLRCELITQSSTLSLSSASRHFSADAREVVKM